MTRKFEDLNEASKKLYDSSLAEIEKELGKEYRIAYESSKKDLEALFLAMVDGVSLAEANKYSRLTKTLDSIEAELATVTKKATKQTYEEMEQSYRDSYFVYVWAMTLAIVNDTALDTKAMKAETPTWGKLDDKLITQTIYDSPSGLPPIDTFKKNLDGLQWELESLIRRNIAIATSSGKAYRKTAKELESLFDKAFSQAMRVVRTEAGRMFSEGFLKAHDEAISSGIKVKKRWVSSLDGRTRDTHGFLDGQYSDKDGWFYSSGGRAQAPHTFGIASEDINCRCDVIDELEGFPSDMRRVGDEIQPYVTFEEWAKPLGWTSSKGWPIKK